VESRRCRAARPLSGRCYTWARSTTARKRPGGRPSRCLTSRSKSITNFPCSLRSTGPPDEVHALSLVLPEMRLRHPRAFGNCWLGCVLWDELGLSAFWDARLGTERGRVPWRKVLQLLVVNRLCEPGSEFAVHRRWFLRSAMDELLGTDFAVADKDRLYRCLDRLLRHKDALGQFLTRQWKMLFDAQFDVLLYDLTSTYFEGRCAEIPRRSTATAATVGGCRQVVIALVVTTDGLPWLMRCWPGTRRTRPRSARSWRRSRAVRPSPAVWVMDRGVPTEETLAEMRTEGVAYLVGTPGAC